MAEFQRVEIARAPTARRVDLGDAADISASLGPPEVRDDNAGTTVTIGDPAHDHHDTYDDGAASPTQYASVVTPTRASLVHRRPRMPIRRRMVVFGGISTVSLPSRVEEENDEDVAAEELESNPRGSSTTAASAEDDGSVEFSTSSTVFLSDSQRWFARIDPHRDLHRFSNRFRDERMEESYQLFSSMHDFAVARRILLFLLFFQIAGYLFFVQLQTSCIGDSGSSVAHVMSQNQATWDGRKISNDDEKPCNKTIPIHETNGSQSSQSFTINGTRFSVGGWDNVTTGSARTKGNWNHNGTECRTYNIPKINRGYYAALWFFTPFAGLYGLFPLKYLENTMRLRIVVYYIRRRWKALAAFIVLVWAVGLDMYLHQLLFAVRDQRQFFISKEIYCARNNTVPESWHAASEWRSNYPKRDYMSLSFWILVYQAKISSSIIMGVLALIATMTGIVSVAVKLDFRHVVFNSIALWIATLVLILTGPSFSLNSRTAHNRGNAFFMFLCVLFPTFLTLLATYSEDRSARLAYASRVRAERMNTTLKLDLSVRKMGLENRNVPKDDKEMIEAELNAGDAKMLKQVAIPFMELELKDVIAKNACGELLLADYHGTQIVLKRLALTSCTLEGLREFKTRVEMLAMLRHPNIVQFLGATFDNLANIGIVMEYLERGDVATLLRSHIALTWSDPLLKIATDVALGVAYLHNCDPALVHRDLKSSNLLCTATYSCKVSDFGESKRQTAGGGLFSTIVGTPYWLAPEVLREERYDVRVDCYSFGIVLVELETRKDPYHDQTELSTIEIMMRVARGTLRPTIPSSCCPRRRNLINRCLDADPSRRPMMTEILHALQNEIRQEIMDQNSFDDSRDRRRVMLMQRHQRLNRQGVRDLLQGDGGN